MTSPDWQQVSLDEVADEITVGYVGPMASEYVDSGIPFLRSLNVEPLRINRNDLKFIDPEFHRKIGKSRLAPGDVVIVRTGKPGACAVVPDWLPDANCSDLVIVRCGKGLNRRFLAYYVNTVASNHVAAHLVGAVQQHFNVGSARTLQIILPPIVEQDAIAGVLGALDDKIEQNRRTSRALEGLARAIFRAWFVDFEPVKAKAAGATAFPGMPQDIFDSLPTRLVDSEVGLIPEGWRIAPLPELMYVNPARVLRKGSEAPYLDMQNMPTEGHSPRAWTTRVAGSGMRFRNGDTLVARITPCLENGKTAYVDFLEDGETAWGSTEYIVLTPKAALPSHFAYCLARTDEFRDFAIQNMTGTSGRQRVSAAVLGHYSMAAPPVDIAVSFGQIVTPLFSLVRGSMIESRKLAELRDYLLPKLLSGSIRVKHDPAHREKVA